MNLATIIRDDTAEPNTNVAENHNDVLQAAFLFIRGSPDSTRLYLRGNTLATTDCRRPRHSPSTLSAPWPQVGAQRSSESPAAFSKERTARSIAPARPRRLSRPPSRSRLRDLSLQSAQPAALWLRPEGRCVCCGTACPKANASLVHTCIGAIGMARLCRFFRRSLLRLRERERAGLLARPRSSRLRSTSRVEAAKGRGVSPRKTEGVTENERSPPFDRPCPLAAVANLARYAGKSSGPAGRPRSSSPGRASRMRGSPARLLSDDVSGAPSSASP